MHTLEDAQIMYMQAGKMMYIAAGQPHMILLLRSGALYMYNMTNPSISKWDNTLQAYCSVLCSI